MYSIFVLDLKLIKWETEQPSASAQEQGAAVAAAQMTD
jgi:hypothetical protein